MTGICIFLAVGLLYFVPQWCGPCSEAVPPGAALRSVVCAASASAAVHSLCFQGGKKVVNVWVACFCFKLQGKFATRAKSDSSLPLMAAPSSAGLNGITPPFQHWSCLPDWF